MKEKSYSIHDIVTFKIINKSNIPNMLFNNISLEYKNFESENIDIPDIVIYLGRFSPSIRECRISDNNYYIREDYFYCKDSYKLAKWEFEMSGFETEVTNIRISTNFFGHLAISGFIIDPVIVLKLNQKGYPVVHGSSISKDGYSYLFTGQSGSGKTLTALYGVEAGFNFLGDDFIILNKSYTMSFLSPLNLGPFNCAPIVKKNMNIRSKIEFLFKTLLYKLVGLNIATKINVKDVFSDSLSEKAKLKSVFVFMPKEKFDIVEIGKEELIEHMVVNMKLDFFPFIKYMMEYSYMFPESNMAEFWDRYRENVKMNLGNITAYKVELPRRYDMRIFKEILRRIKNGDY